MFRHRVGPRRLHRHTLSVIMSLLVFAMYVCFGLSALVSSSVVRRSLVAIGVFLALAPSGALWYGVGSGRLELLSEKDRLGSGYYDWLRRSRFWKYVQAWGAMMFGAFGIMVCIGVEMPIGTYFAIIVVVSAAFGYLMTTGAMRCTLYCFRCRDGALSSESECSNHGSKNGTSWRSR